MESPARRTRSQTKRQASSSASTSTKKSVSVTSSRRQHSVKTRDAPQENGAGAAVSSPLAGHVSTFSEKITPESRFSGFINRTLMPLYLIIQSPILVILLHYIATKCNGSVLIFVKIFQEKGFLGAVQKIWLETSLFSYTALYIILAYSLFAVFLQVVLPGPKARGPITPKGNVPLYKNNGFYCFWVTVVVFIALTYKLKQDHGISTTYVYDHFDEFLGTVTIVSFIFCIFLYIKGIVAPSSSDYGLSGNIIFDYYWGSELYPRIFGIDVKTFTNCRFGMTIWPLLCIVFALKSYEIHGFVDSIWISCALQLVYCIKFFWWEAGYMGTIDVMVDRAGFYICWGCMVYVPGLYACTCMFMIPHPVQLGPIVGGIIFACGVLSIALNYWADYQKQIARSSDGRCNIWGKKADVIRAKYRLESGEIKHSILLVSGFWGVARHFHYIPELMLSFFWCLPTLGHCMMSYTYFIWLCLLLTHRTFRDDKKCGDKYGHYWTDYCRRVPYKMIPGIF